MSTPALEYARILFENYVDTTRHIERCTGVGPNYRYPPGANELDMLALAAVFSNVWQAIGEWDVYKQHHAQKPAAFKELENITEPDPVHHPYNAFWIQDAKDPAKLVLGDVKKPDVMHLLCRTLRNGFNHFNYRYVHESPRQYFARLTKPMPNDIRDKDKVECNYRIFICDHRTEERVGKKKRKLTLMDPNSKTRILETHFGHIRFHLYCFLDQFFQAEGARPALELMALGKGIHAK